MSRFAAIEARATQFPTSTNDVVWLVQQVRDLRDVLQAIKDNGHGDGTNECAACMAIDALEALEEPNLPID